MHTHIYVYFFLLPGIGSLFLKFLLGWWQAPVLCNDLSLAFTPETMSSALEWALPSQTLPLRSHLCSDILTTIRVSV